MRPRPIADPAAVVADEVARLKARFQYPDRAFAPESVSPVGGGGGGGAPTVVVAAADASDLSKARADYVCSGTNDQTTIRAAIDQLALTFGGRVLLTEGAYHIVIDQTDTLPTTYGTHFQGMNSDSTVLLVDTAPAVTNRNLFQLISDCTVSDLQIRQTAYNQTWRPIRLEGDRNFITRVQCWNLASGTNGVISGSNVGLTETWITHNLFDGCPVVARLPDMIQVVFALNVMDNSSGIELIHSSNEGLGAVIADNIWRNPSDDEISAVIHVEGFQSPVIQGNAVHSPTVGFIYVSTSGGAAVVGNTVHQACCNVGHISIVDCLGAAVVGNQIDGFGDPDADVAILISGTSDGTLVADNTIRSDQDEAGNWLSIGIHLSSVDSCVVTGNLIRQVADDGIRVAGDLNFVTANSIRPSALTPQSEVGINVASGTDNMVVGNDLGDPAAYNTDALVDAGTTTALVYPNDATYGDNFTL